MNKPKINEGVVSGSIGMLSRMMAQLCLLAVTLTATRVLAVGQFGIYSIAASLMVLSRNLFYVGPYEYLLKTPETPGLRGACLRANLCIAVLSMCALMVFSLAARYAFHTTELPYLLVRLAPSLLISAVTAWYEAILLRALAIRRYYVFTVIGEALATIASIGCLIAGFGILSLIVQVYSRLGALMVLYLLVVSREGWRGGSMDEVKTVLRWSWSRFGAVFLNFSANYGADFVLGIVLSPVATGIYRASNRIVSAISDLFAQPLQKIVQTNISARSARGLAPDQGWITMLLSVAAIGWAALIGMAVAAETVVPVVLGPAWTGAVPVVMVFCYARALSLIDVTTTSLLVCCDRQRFMLVVQVIVAVSVPALSLIAASHNAHDSSMAPVVVAMVNALVMSGLTFTYGREAARLSGTSTVAVTKAFALALIPGACVALCLSLMRHAPFVSGLAPPTLVALLVVAGGIGLGSGLLMIRRRLLASIATLGSPRAVVE